MEEVRVILLRQAKVAAGMRCVRKFDSCRYNSVKLGFMLKIMPLNGMDFNMKSNFKKL